MTEASPLGPIDPSSVTSTDQQNAETEKKAPWIVRKLVGVGTPLMRTVRETDGSTDLV